jgi:TRAP-type C4-dicarboxylate transport system substrate-binding protein
MPTRRAPLDRSDYGAAPTAPPLDAVYAALELGKVGGRENPFAQMWPSKFHEAQRSLSLSGRVCTPARLVIGRDVIGRDVRRLPRGIQTLR